MPHWVSCFREISEQHVTQKDHMYSGAAAIWGVSCGSFYFFYLPHVSAMETSRSFLLTPKNLNPDKSRSALTSYSP